VRARICRNTNATGVTTRDDGIFELWADPGIVALTLGDGEKG
jgi:hypothetical protein